MTTALPEQGGELREKVLLKMTAFALGRGDLKRDDMPSIQEATDDMVQLFEAYRKQHELEARKNQTFKVIKSLVKSGNISDSSAAHVLALQTTLIDAELKAERERLGG